MLLIDEGKRWLRSRGVKSVQVHVLADNEPARRLYERAGLVAADVRMMGALTED
jgi:ribosomal protein S18 acetylase RimI-like enzyme